MGSKGSCQGIERTGREVEHSFPTTPDVGHNGSYNTTPPYVFLALCLIMHEESFFLNCDVNKPLPNSKLVIYSPVGCPRPITQDILRYSEDCHLQRQIKNVQHPVKWHHTKIFKQKSPTIRPVSIELNSVSRRLPWRSTDHYEECCLLRRDVV
jgi:hypothetical protein